MMLQVHCFGGLIQVASGVELKRRKKSRMSIASGGPKLDHVRVTIFAASMGVLGCIVRT